MIRLSSRFLHTAIIGLAAGLVGTLPGKTITIDGDPSDWSGTPDPTIHTVVINHDEWIYSGEANDIRTDPNVAALPNYDITEVHLANDNDYLYLLVRLSDVITTNEVSVCLGVDDDMDSSDANGLNFLGDDSGLTFGSQASLYPEYTIQFHNAQDGITWPEYFHETGGGTWYTNSGDADVFVSATNDLLEARIKLTSIGLTATSAFGVSVVTFDNGTTADPNGTAFANDDDTTVDYPGHDGIDGIGGMPGVSQNSVARVFPPPGGTDPGPYVPLNIPIVQLPIVSAGVDWFTLE